MKVYILAILYFILILPVKAQNIDQQNWLTVTMDNNQFGSLFDSPLENLFKTDKPSFSIGVEHYYNRNFNFSGKISRGEINPKATIRTANTDLPENRTVFTNIEITGVFKLNNGVLLPTNSKFTPFLETGLGLFKYHRKIPDKSDGFVGIPFTAGMRYLFNENVQAVAKVSQNAHFTMAHRRFSFGISVALRSKIDSDQDGLYDDEDDCPELYGFVNNNGCPYPDKDQDGFIDINDACPDVSGTLNGCPDQDQDGIADAEDLCPKQSGPPQSGGCPDSDNDGVVDAEDKCPNLQGNLNGCPDWDDDGIDDGSDYCPYDPGTLANLGCPDLNLAENQIHFKFNSIEIHDSYKKSIDRLANILIRNPQLKISLKGYTDNIGSQDNNKELSLRRAQSIKTRLQEKGIDGNRIFTDGLGKINAKADNNTDAGRARNRRVVINMIQ